MLERRAARREFFVREKRERSIRKPPGKAAVTKPEKIVVIGGGAAGFAAAEMLRRIGYQNSIVIRFTPLTGHDLPGRGVRRREHSAVKRLKPRDRRIIN